MLTSGGAGLLLGGVDGGSMPTSPSPADNNGTRKRDSRAVPVAVLNVGQDRVDRAFAEAARARPGSGNCLLTLRCVHGLWGDDSLVQLPKSLPSLRS